MKNKIHKYDFLIIGAGLIGALTALELFRKNYKLLVIEKTKLPLTDNRTLAVNANSRDFLNSLGLWKSLQQEPIEKIIISEQITNNNLDFTAKNESMGSVIYNRELLQRAIQKLKKNHLLIQGINVSMNKIEDAQNIKIKNKYYSFKKIIISTGKHRIQNKKIKETYFSSGHCSYVGFYSHTLDHNNHAYEIFTNKGPLAVLPAPAENKKLSTFIYSSKSPTTENQIKNLIKDNFSKMHGQIFFKKGIFKFNISPRLSRSRHENLILLGDSLRSIHPVAGQGWNLGVKDIIALSDILDRYAVEDASWIEIYYAKRLFESSAYLSFTNLINLFFEKETPLTQFSTNFIFKTLQLFPLLKKTFISQAMGRLNLI